MPRSSSHVAIQRSTKPVVAALDQILQPHHLVAVIVVVGLVDVAKRIDGQLVRIPEVLRQDLEACAIQVHAKRNALEVTFAIAILRRALRHEVLARLVGDVEAGIAVVEVELAVRSEDDGVQTVVVVDATEARQHDFLLQDVVVLILRVDGDVRRLRNIHLVAEHGDAERHADVRSLIEHLGPIRFPVVVGVFENDDAVTLGPEVGLHARLAPIVHAFEHPHPAALVHGQIRRVLHVGFGREERDGEARRWFQAGQGLSGALLSADSYGQKEDEYEHESCHDRSPPGSGI